MSKRSIIGLIVLVVIIAGVIWFVTAKDKEQPTPVLSVTAFNQTKNTPAESVSASTDDLIVYSLNAENQTDEVITGYVVEAKISEITDKATLIDASGASYNSATNSLVWTPLDIPAHGSITKQFSVRVNTIASTGSNLTIRFNNEVKIALGSSTPPVVAGNLVPPYVAPTTGASEMIPLLFAVLVTAGFVLKRKLAWG